MITTPARRRAPLAVAVITLLALGTSGCFQNPIEAVIQGAVNDTVEGAIEDATGTDIDVDLDGSGASIPEGFPSELPLPEGRLVATLGVDGTYVLTFETTGDAADAIVERYRSDGWNVVSEADYGDLKLFAFENGQWQASISSVVDGEVVQVQVTATPVQN